MSIELKRTAVHDHGRGSESVINVSVITFHDGEKSIHVSNDDHDGNSIMVHGVKQLGDLIAALKAVGSEIFE